MPHSHSQPAAPNTTSETRDAHVATADQQQVSSETWGRVATGLLVVAGLWTLLSWCSTAFGQPPAQPGAMQIDPVTGQPIPVDPMSQLEPLKPEELEFRPEEIDEKWRDQFLLVNELIRADEYNVFYKTENNKFRQALKSENLTKDERDVIVKGARIRTLRLSLEENRRTLRDGIDELIKDLELYGTGKPARELALQEITKNAELLLQNQFHVRIAAAILLRSLNSEKANTIKRTPARPYVGALDVLLKILNDPQQHEAVKIQAVKGVERICTDSAPPPTVDIRMKIAQAIVNELKTNQATPWYQMVLARALGAANISVNLQQQPFVAQILLEVMNDRNRHPMVRCEAARSLGRVPFENPAINMPLIAYEMGELAYEMGLYYNRYPTLSYWSTCFWNIYLGFHPENPVEESRDAGLLRLVDKPAFRASAPLVQTAYQNVLKVVNAVLNEPTIGNRRAMDATKFQPLAQWLQQSKPATEILQPGMPPLSPPAASPTPATNNNQAAAN